MQAQQQQQQQQMAAGQMANQQQQQQLKHLLMNQQVKETVQFIEFQAQTLNCTEASLGRAKYKIIKKPLTPSVGLMSTVNTVIPGK